MYKCLSHPQSRGVERFKELPRLSPGLFVVVGIHPVISMFLMEPHSLLAVRGCINLVVPVVHMLDLVVNIHFVINLKEWFTAVDGDVVSRNPSFLPAMGSTSQEVAIRPDFQYDELVALGKAEFQGVIWREWRVPIPCEVVQSDGVECVIWILMEPMMAVILMLQIALFRVRRSSEWRPIVSKSPPPGRMDSAISSSPFKFPFV